jgi:hypothetical protein
VHRSLNARRALLVAGIGCALVDPRLTGAQAAPSPTVDASGFTRAQLLDDAAFLFRTIEQVHPAPYLRLDSSGARSVRRARGAFEAALTDGMGRLDFWRLAAPVVALLRDGHTALLPPREQLERQRRFGSTMFPLVLRLDSVAATVRADLSYVDRLPDSTRILAINGRPMAELIGEGMATLPYERDELRLWALNRTFADMIPTAWGWTGPFVVSAVLPSGESMTDTIAAISSEEWTNAARTANLLGRPAAPYTFSYLADSTLGYIAFGSHVDPADFSGFLERTFAHLRRRAPRALVIDLRHNAGGSSEPGDKLLSYLTSNPRPQFSRIDLKASKAVKDEQRRRIPRLFRWLPAWVLGILDGRLAFLRSPDGAIVRWPAEKDVVRRESLRWKGPVFVLVGLGTYSSGADLAAALQDYGIATIVGEETGGLASSFGDTHRALLPNTGLQLNVSYKYFIRPSGVEGMRGVIPDLPAPSAPTATLEQDSTIVRVLEALKHDRPTAQNRGLSVR